MRNPFDASVSLVTAQTIVKKDSEEKASKEPRTMDKIKVFLACVPSLEDAKTDLKEVIDQVDESVKAEIDSFIEQIEQIQVKVLEFTQMTISRNSEGKVEAKLVPEVDAVPESASLSDVLASRIDDSEISKMVLADIQFSDGKIIMNNRSASSVIRQIPDATR